MIPISRWLAEREAPNVIELPLLKDCAEADQPLTEPDGVILPSQEELAFQRGYGEGIAAAEAGFAERLETMRRAAAVHEEELVETWVQRCGETVAQSIEVAFAQLQSAIEQALHEVLLPFLEDAIRRQAADELLRMIRHELAGSGDHPVEVRAPAVVLARLRDELGSLCKGAVLTEAGTVEVRTRGGAAVFESMAGRWIETLRGHQSHE